MGYNSGFKGLNTGYYSTWTKANFL